MVRLNLFFIIHGEEEEGHKSSRLDLPNMSTLHNPTRQVLTDLTHKIDPSLTRDGYIQAETTFRSLANAFRAFGEPRKIALLSEPFRRCTASAIMIASAGFEPQAWSGWGLTTPSTAKAPTAIPIVIENGLIDASGNVRHMGGQKVVLDGGLLHCAALDWNKEYRKDPIMGVVQEMKDDIQEYVKAWEQKKNVQTHDNDPNDRRLVTDVQFLRYAKKGDPYSLTPASLKFNLTTDLLKPNKILDPRRQGVFHSTPPPLPDSVSQHTLDRAVETARKAGCDTILMVVTPELVYEVFDRMERDIGEELDNGAIVSLVAKTKADGISYKPFGICGCGAFTTEMLPPYCGPLEPSKEPPEEWQKAMEESGEEKWGAFPPPPPECLGPSYPQDIPPFSQCLDKPEPMERWAWIHMPK